MRNILSKSENSVKNNFIFPDKEKGLDQDEEFFYYDNGEGKRKIQFHDCNEIFKIEGLYEDIFYKTLKCTSPQVISEMLHAQIVKEGQSLENLRLLDFGAGNGLVTKTLTEFGLKNAIGMDIIPEAKNAAMRDHPALYKNYLIADCCNLSAVQKSYLEEQNLNTLVTVAALGYDDIPPEAFASAFNLISNDGWIAFNIRDKFVEQEHLGFKPVLEKIYCENIAVLTEKKYVHRFAIDGTPLQYYAVVGKKKKNIVL